MKQSTATAIVSQYTPPRGRREETAGPCTVEGCGGQLEIRHERQFGKLYTACSTCERRVLEVRQLREQIARLKQSIEQRLGVPGKYPCRKCGGEIYGRGPRAHVCIRCSDEAQSSYMRDYWKRRVAP